MACPSFQGQERRAGIEPGLPPGPRGPLRRSSAFQEAPLLSSKELLLQPHQWLKNWPLSRREARERPPRGSVKILAQVGEEVSLFLPKTWWEVVGRPALPFLWDPGLVTQRLWFGVNERTSSCPPRPTSTELEIGSSF